MCVDSDRGGSRVMWTFTCTAVTVSDYFGNPLHYLSRVRIACRSRRLRRVPWRVPSLNRALPRVFSHNLSKSVIFSPTIVSSDAPACRYAARPHGDPLTSPSVSPRDTPADRTPSLHTRIQLTPAGFLLLAGRRHARHGSIASSFNCQRQPLIVQNDAFRMTGGGFAPLLK